MIDLDAFQAWLIEEDWVDSFDLIIQQPDGSQPVFRITVEELDR